MSYTIDQVADYLVSHHGEKVRFVLDRIRRDARYRFEVRNLGGVPGGAIGTDRGVSVDSGAGSLAEAARWTMNGLRMWAGRGVPLSRSGETSGPTYFAEAAREWAKSGSNARDVPACLGSTLDFLYLFSSETSCGVPTDDMYPVCSATRTDLFNIYYWIFASKWRAIGPERTHAAVSMSSRFGLYRDFWNSEPDQPLDVDQTHHFAGYFWLGARAGCNPDVVLRALEHTTDAVNHGFGDPTIVNPGDVLLGLLAAQWGVLMTESPAYIGHQVAQSLRTNSGWPLSRPNVARLIRIHVPSEIRTAP